MPASEVVGRYQVVHDSGLDGLEVEVLRFEVEGEPSLVTARCGRLLQFIEWDAVLRFRLDDIVYQQDAPMLYGLADSGYVYQGEYTLYPNPASAPELVADSVVEAEVGPWEHAGRMLFYVEGPVDGSELPELSIDIYAGNPPTTLVLERLP